MRKEENYERIRSAHKRFTPKVGYLDSIEMIRESKRLNPFGYSSSYIFDIIYKKDSTGSARKRMKKAKIMH